MSANAGNAAGTAPAVPDKGDWPRTEHGTVDWEAAFERGEHALIAMVEQTATQAGILACGMVIIRALFSRANDAEERVDYERQLNEAMAASFDGDDVESDDVRRARVIALLREIKEARIERANFHIARIKAGIDAPSERRGAGKDEDKPAAPVVDENISAQAAFVEALSRLIGGRLEALRIGIEPGTIAGAPPPYPVSADFAERFDKLVRDQFAPAMTAACRPFIMQADHREPTERVAYILKNMEERRSREILWESWRIVWRDLTDEQGLPKKPKEEKQSLLSRFKKKQAQPAWKGESLTVEEWEEEVERIEAANARARDIWARLTAPDKRYQAPDDSDRKTLMNLFARTAGALTKQIGAVRQIAEQGGNAGKVFSDYQQGKDIDLPLLCACCQNPELFIEKGMLKEFMRGFPDTMKRDRFTLMTRFFGEFC